MFSSAMPRGASLWHADGQNPHELQFYAKLNLHRQSGYEAGTAGVLLPQRALLKSQGPYALNMNPTASHKILKTPTKSSFATRSSSPTHPYLAQVTIPSPSTQPSHLHQHLHTAALLKPNHAWPQLLSFHYLYHYLHYKEWQRTETRWILLKDTLRQLPLLLFLSIWALNSIVSGVIQSYYITVTITFAWQCGPRNSSGERRPVNHRRLVW